MKKFNIIAGLLALIVLGIGGRYYYTNYIDVDETAPVITAEKETIKCSIEATNKELCEGLTAADDRDGDLSDQIMVNDVKIKKEKGAKYNEFTISYVVFDAANNMGTYERSLIYSDYEAPKFDISDPLQFSSFADANLNLQTYLTATDCIEGDISSQIVLDLDSELLDSAATGTYTCNATVENRFGDSSTIPLTIDINADGNDTGINRPSIQLSDYIIYVEKGDKITKKSYIESVIMNYQKYTEYKVNGELVTDEQDADEANASYTSYDTTYTDSLPDIKVKSDLDTSKLGTYTINYSVKDSETSQTGNATLIVVVERSKESGKK